LTSYAALEREPILADEFVHVVALDPPALPGAAALDGTLYTHLAWGEPELRFAQQIHEMEYGLRASLVALYRGLRQRGTAFGEELERLLRGEGRHGLPARVAGRLIRVLAELELVSLDRVLPALAIAGSAPTTLERSPAYNEYRRRYEDGKRYLTNATASRSSGRRP
jgi:single-stranded-DNA-specific exonuclease